MDAKCHSPIRRKLTYLGLKYLYEDVQMAPPVMGR